MQEREEQDGYSSSNTCSFIFYPYNCIVGWWTLRRRKQKARKVDSKSITSNTYESMEWNSRQFSCSEVVKITYNFKNVLGKGGFGTVYHGYTDNTEVAVKIHSQLSVQGYKQSFKQRYYISNRLTEKSDVYSFGVILLEIITGRPVISKSLENVNTHISQGLCSMLSKGDIRNVGNPRLEGDFDINSVWKAVEIATVCVSSTSTRRPTMNHVVVELDECLATEITRKKEGRDEYEAKDFTEMIPVDLQTAVSLSC